MGVMTTTPAPAQSSPPAPSIRHRTPKLPYLFLVPAMAVLLLALGYPLYRQMVMSFQEFGLAQQFGELLCGAGIELAVSAAG